MFAAVRVCEREWLGQMPRANHEAGTVGLPFFRHNNSKMRLSAISSRLSARPTYFILRPWSLVVGPWSLAWGLCVAKSQCQRAWLQHQSL